MSTSSKETFLRIWDREFRTIDVFRSFPEEALEARPHQRSRSARELAGQCVVDERVIRTIAERPVHDLSNLPLSPPVPETMSDVAATYEAGRRDSVAKVNSLTRADFGRTVTSILNSGVSRWGRPLEWSMPQPDAFGANVMDHVHHRGQLTVYLRQAGGRVPAISGPSSDQSGPAY